MPINLPNGANVEEIVLPDGSQAERVIGPNGSTVWERNAIPDSGVSRWDFEDSSDTSTAIDSWGDNNGTIDGATYNDTTVKVGNYSLNFADNESDEVKVPANSSLDLTTEITMSAWVYPTGLSDDEGRYVIMSNGDMNNDRVALYHGGSPNLDEGFSWRADNRAIVGQAANDGQWYHVVGTFADGTGTLYVDGTQEDTVSGSLAYNNNDLTIGHNKYVSSAYDWDGYIDDPRIYDKALSSSEVADLYNTGSI